MLRRDLNPMSESEGAAVVVASVRVTVVLSLKKLLVWGVRSSPQVRGRVCISVVRLGLILLSIIKLHATYADANSIIPDLF